MQSVYPGDLIIEVQDDIEDWVEGDEIILGGSALDGTEYERVIIESIDKQSITLKSPLQFYHYGG